MKRDPAVTSKIMAAVKSKRTRPEQLLAKALWSLGLRYRRHLKIKGTPDFAFVSVKVAVFCDGDFWHGNNWRLRDYASLDDELSHYSDYWAQKIRSNVARDRMTDSTLSSDGWLVLRFWESEIRADPLTCAEKIRAAVESRKTAKRLSQCSETSDS
jgi:DNA mismatch endonuclease (patch repair protein)